MMKKLSIIIIALMVTSFAQAQSNVVASAYNYHKSGMPDKAVDEINKAILHESTKNDAKTWFYRGNIYLQLYTFAHMTDGLVANMTSTQIIQRYGEPDSRRPYKKIDKGQRWYYPNNFSIFLSDTIYNSYEFIGEEGYKAKDDGKLLETALESYVKVNELDPKFIRMELNPQTAGQGISHIASLYYNDGVDNFTKGKHEEALASFERACGLYTQLGDYDENLTLYTGYAAESINDTTKAIKYYNQLVDKKIKNENLYMKLAYLYLGKSDYNNALRVVKVGREVLPEKQNLLLTEANIYLQTDRAKEAEKILKMAAEKDPDNKQLYFAIGANYDKMVNDTLASAEFREEAFNNGKAAYIRAIELDPNYFDALYNLGAMLNNKAASLITQANNLPISETKKYDELLKRGTELLTEAKPYLEKCHSLDPKDKNTMIMLRGVYSQTKDYDNLKKINAELKAL